MTITDERTAGAPAYRRRRRLPALALLVVLAALVGVVWVRVLGSESQIAGAVACPAPTPAAGGSASAAPTAGTTVDRAELANSAPGSPQATVVRVLNANGTRGQAGLVSAELAALDFTRAATNPVGDDTVYPDQDMQCVGQIRFGAKGLPYARTLALVVPCAQLVRDGRTDAGVDLALGTTFGDVAPSAAASSVIATISAAKKAGTTAEVDPTLLADATNARC